MNKIAFPLAIAAALVTPLAANTILYGEARVSVNHIFAVGTRVLF